MHLHLLPLCAPADFSHRRFCTSGDGNSLVGILPPFPSFFWCTSKAESKKKQYTQNSQWGESRTENWKCILLESRLTVWWNESNILTVFSGACIVQEVKTSLWILSSFRRLNTSSAAQHAFQAISIFMNFLDTFLIFHLKMSLLYPKPLHPLSYLQFLYHYWNRCSIESEPRRRQWK